MEKHGDQAAVRSAYKYFVLDFHRFPLKYPFSECPLIIVVFVFSQSGETPEIKVHHSCKIHFPSRSRLPGSLMQRSKPRTSYCKFYVG